MCVFVYVVICVYVNYSVTRHGRRMFVMQPQSMDIAEVATWLYRERLFVIKICSSTELCHDFRHYA